MQQLDNDIRDEFLIATFPDFQIDTMTNIGICGGDQFIDQLSLITNEVNFHLLAIFIMSNFRYLIKEGF